MVHAELVQQATFLDWTMLEPEWKVLSVSVDDQHCTME
jgi:hypothetical protein